MVRKLSLLMFTAFFIMTTSRTLESIADEKNDGRVVEMSVRPAAEPEYILRYSFRPEFQDERQGNAVTYYNTAAALYNQLKEEHKETSEKIRKWLELPIEKLPQKEIRDILETFQNTFAYIHKGSLRERCFWEFPIREERVYEILMPNLGTFRNIARALALQARLQIAEGHIEQAMQTLQTGFMLARHLGEAPILIHNLVGIAIAQIMLEATEHLIQSPDTSNLYWALTELHSPFISMKEAMRVERSLIFIEFPQLQTIEESVMSSRELKAIQAKISRLRGMIAESNVSESTYNSNEPAEIKRTVSYSLGQKYLVAKERTPKEINQMPPLQVVLIYHTHQFELLRGHNFKWFYVPFHQAWTGLNQSEENFQKMLKNKETGAFENPFLRILPAVGRAYLLGARLDRTMAALRCVEAIRLYAAGHNGRLPDHLEAIEGVPLPHDPLHGKPFIYTLSDHQAVIESPAPAGATPKDRLRYILTIKKSKAK